jgi:tRNA dimethylallyltransferase
VAILGPTAAGKSAVAMEIARRVVGADILSVDSMQVYRGMDIGTAKPTLGERMAVTHHMLDLVDPDESFTVAQFREEARRALATTTAQVVLVVGGSGLHFRAVVDPMTFAPQDPEVRGRLDRIPLPVLVEELTRADPAAGELVDLANRRRVARAVEAWRVGGVTPTMRADSEERRRFEAYRPEIPFSGVVLDRSDPAEAVTGRLEGMRAAGFLEEVEQLAPRMGRTASQAVGYRQLLRVVEGEVGLEDGYDEARRATMRLVKRQRTFFRRDPRLTWLDADRPDLVEAVMAEVGL